MIIYFIFRTSNSSSGVALIFVDDSGENVIVAVQGANAELSPNDIEKARPAIELSDILVLQLEIPLETVIHTISIAKSKNIPVVLNPAPGKKLDPSIIKCINYLTPNETEAEILTGMKVIDDNTAKEAGLKLMEFGSENVIITMGKRGAMLITESECELIPGFKVEAIDTTAAGDAFNGGLAYAIASQKSVKDAVRFANAVAALSVTKMGAQPSMPFKSEVDEFILRGDE
ncbi:MAG: PfkB family carbohydrate kinase [bacterium]